MRPNSTLSKMYHWTFLGRRLLLAVILVEFANEPIKQILCLLGSSIFIFLWHVLIRPFKDKLVNALAMLNELLLLGVGFLCI